MSNDLYVIVWQWRVRFPALGEENERFAINSVGDGIGSHLEMSKVNIMLKWIFHEANENGYDLQLSALQEEEQKNLMVRTACV